MSEDTTNSKSCGGKKNAMLAYGIVQISATVISALSLAAIALGLCSIKQESKAARLLSSGTLPQTRPGVPSGTVADYTSYHHLGSLTIIS